MAKQQDLRLRVIALFGGVAKYGAERANLEALTALRAQGAEVLLMVSGAAWAEEMRRELLARGFTIRTCPYLLLPRPERSVIPWLHWPPVMVLASLTLIRAARSFKPTHVQAGNQLYVLNFLPALMLMKTPLIYRCGDRPVLHSGGWRSSWNYIVKRASRFVAVSRFIREDLIAKGVDPEDVEVIYSRPPTRPKATCQAPAPTDPGPFDIVYAGQINEAKGCGVLLDAFRRLLPEFPRTRLFMAGRISDWEGDAWARQFRDRIVGDPDLSDAIHLLGFVEDVPGLMARCRLHVAPTVSEEPLANVVMEAKKAGIPSVVFPSGGLPEVVESGVDGAVCANRSADALYAALRNYLLNPRSAEVQGDAARASLTRLGVDEFEARWREVYDRTRGRA